MARPTWATCRACPRRTRGSRPTARWTSSTRSSASRSRWPECPSARPPSCAGSQNDLFDVGADISVPHGGDRERLRVIPEQTAWLERRARRGQRRARAAEVVRPAGRHAGRRAAARVPHGLPPRRAPRGRLRGRAQPGVRPLPEPALRPPLHPRPRGERGRRAALGARPLPRLSERAADDQGDRVRVGLLHVPRRRGIVRASRWRPRPRAGERRPTARPAGSRSRRARCPRPAPHGRGADGRDGGPAEQRAGEPGRERLRPARARRRVERDADARADGAGGQGDAGHAAGHLVVLGHDALSSRFPRPARAPVPGSGMTLTWGAPDTGCTGPSTGDCASSAPPRSHLCRPLGQARRPPRGPAGDRPARRCAEARELLAELEAEAQRARTGVLPRGARRRQPRGGPAQQRRRPAARAQPGRTRRRPRRAARLDAARLPESRWRPRAATRSSPRSTPAGRSACAPLEDGGARGGDRTRLRAGGRGHARRPRAARPRRAIASPPPSALRARRWTPRRSAAPRAGSGATPAVEPQPDLLHARRCRHQLPAAGEQHAAAVGLAQHDAAAAADTRRAERRLAQRPLAVLVA